LPLSEKARVEVYVPDLLLPAYENLLVSLEQEFTYTFGGCTIVRGLHGSYLSEAGFPIADRINLIYTDASIRFEPNLTALSRFTDKLRQAAFDALQEEAVLVVAHKVYDATE
jgi:hypothetical protein